VHPEDVAELLESELGRLRDAVQDAPGLRVASIELEDGPRVVIAFSKLERPRLDVLLPTDLLGPLGNPFGQQFQGVDLATKVERQLLLVVGCENLDGDPPTAELWLPDRTPLPAEEWPAALMREGVINGHPDYDRPFFCRQGLREYHSHPQHEDEPWDKHRESLPMHTVVLGLLDDLQGKWLIGA
jgi:Predicted metal binding domain